MAEQLADQAVRERISTDLGSTLFIEAGAGSGKTTVLVERIVALVVHAGIPVEHLAAVTFTEKAAAELRDRIRVGLEELAGEDGIVGERAEVALDDLDGAAIGTLHSFAGRILAEHPIEAGLPPLVQVVDEVAAQVGFERRWHDLRVALLDDAELAPTLRLVLAVGIDLERHLRPLARDFDANWDLVDEHIVRRGEPGPVPEASLELLRHQAEDVLAMGGRCADVDDKLAQRLTRLRTWIADVDAAEQSLDRFVLLGAVPDSGLYGARRNWPDTDLTSLRQALADLRGAAFAQRSRVLDAALRRVAYRIAVHTVQAATERRTSGRLTFHDLLVLARTVLRDPVHGARVRADLRERYQRILLDEFQDTDPIQIELAVRIAAGADGDAADWREVPVPPGALFVVGDPKQSIYRFRRADIGAFLAARTRLGGVLDLTTNFRATPDLLSWINTVFGALIQPTADSQPEYVGLDPDPSRPVWSGAGPAILAVGPDAHPVETNAERVRELEAADVAGTILRAVAEGWQVDERVDGSWQRRPLRLGDITILVPTRTSIGALESAFDQAGIPFRTDATSLVYSSREVRDLMLAARALADPTDQLALVSTLRSTLFGCGDDDLWRWKEAGGRWSIFAPPPDDVPPDDPVRESMTWLRSAALARPQLAPVELLDRIVRERHQLELAVDADGVGRPRHRETWRRIRYMLDQARAWSEAEHGTLREYLAWAARQAEESARVSEPVLPESDEDAVRIMTIHAAKGLQFPMVIVSGLGSRWPTSSARALWSAGGYQLRVTRYAETAGYADAAAVERELEHAEDLRLLYVACTRAESHLVVSLHRTARRYPARDQVSLSLAELLASASVSTEQETWTCAGELSVAPPLPAVAAATPVPFPSWTEWQVEHARAVAQSTLPAAVSATDVAHGRAPVELPSVAIAGLAKQPRDLELPPWAKGRYGTAVGRAVHAVLQTVSLATGDGLEPIAESLAHAEGVGEHSVVVAAMSRSASASPVIGRAATREHWKETYVGTIIDDVLVEGYVDLLYREDDGRLVIVDYKTDAAPTEETVRAYATQLSLYARAVHDATGSPADCVLLFCSVDSTATELWLPL